MKNNTLAVIPAYNEESSIGKIVDSLKTSSVEVLVVNDHSSDNTGLVATHAGAKVINLDKNRGYSFAISRGLELGAESGEEFIVTLDADGQHSVAEVLEISKFCEDNQLDAVVGVRPRFARLSEWLFACHFKKRYRILDPLCGLKCYRTRSLRRVMQKEKFEFDSIGMEYILKLAHSRFAIGNYPVSISQRAQGVSRFGRIMGANFKILGALNKIKKLASRRV